MPLPPRLSQREAVPGRGAFDPHAANTYRSAGDDLSAGDGARADGPFGTCSFASSAHPEALLERLMDACKVRRKPFLMASNDDPNTLFIRRLPLPAQAPLQHNRHRQLGHFHLYHHFPPSPLSTHHSPPPLQNPPTKITISAITIHHYFHLYDRHRRHDRSHHHHRITIAADISPDPCPKELLRYFCQHI